MGALSDVLAKAKMGGLSKAIPGAEESATGLEMEDDEEEEGSDETEVKAMSLFMKATTPEQKASAMKSFLKACGAY